MNALCTFLHPLFSQCVRVIPTGTEGVVSKACLDPSWDNMYRDFNGVIILIYYYVWEIVWLIFFVLGVSVK